MATTRKPNYVPPSGLLSKAIADEIEGSADATPSAKDLRVDILKQHPTWIVPERRVAKFLKLYLKKQKNASAGEDESQKSSKSQSRAMRFVRGVFGKRSSEKKGEDKIPEVIEEAAQESAPEPSPSPEPSPVEPPPETEEVNVEVEDKKVDPYVDDNVGEKKDDCACAACVIL